MIDPKSFFNKSSNEFPEMCIHSSQNLNNTLKLIRIVSEINHRHMKRSAFFMTFTISCELILFAILAFQIIAFQMTIDKVGGYYPVFCVLVTFLITLCNFNATVVQGIKVNNFYDSYKAVLSQLNREI